MHAWPARAHAVHADAILCWRCSSTLDDQARVIGGVCCSRASMYAGFQCFFASSDRSVARSSASPTPKVLQREPQSFITRRASDHAALRPTKLPVCLRPGGYQAAGRAVQHRSTRGAQHAQRLPRIRGASRGLPRQHRRSRTAAAPAQRAAPGDSCVAGIQAGCWHCSSPCWRRT